MNFFKKSTAFLFFILLSTFCIAQSDFLDLRADLQKELDQIIVDDNFPGATVAVVLPDGRLISLAGGFDDKELAKPMRVGGQMFTGSTGKIFASTVALQLVSEGKFSLDDKVAKYLADEDWFSKIPNATDLTIRSLMNHTSGLPRYVFEESFLKAVKDTPMRFWKPRECMAVISGLPAKHLVGQGWGYSDTNYILLGIIMEKVTGDTFYNLSKNRLLLPLNLSNTYPSTQRALPGLVQGYIGENNFFSLPPKTVENGLYAMNPQFEWTGGGYITNVEDMAFLLKWLHGGKVLSPTIYKELIQPVAFETGQPSETGYGLGTFVWETDLGKFLGHAGIMPGHLTQVEYSEKYQFSIAFQVNTDAGLGRKHHGHVQHCAGIVANYLKGQHKIEEQAILDNFKQQEDCWNEGSIECYMKAYVKSDSIRTISRNGVTYGYEPILQNYLKYYPEGTMGKLHFDQVNLTRLSEEYYYVTGRFNLTQEGKPEPRQGYFSVLMQKIEGRWLLVSDHS